MKNIRHFANLTHNTFEFKTYYSSTLQNTDEKKIFLIRSAQILIICESPLVVEGKTFCKKKKKKAHPNCLVPLTVFLSVLGGWSAWDPENIVFDYAIQHLRPFWPTDHPRSVHGPLMHIAHKNGSSNLIGYLTQLQGSPDRLEIVTFTRHLVDKMSAFE